MNKSKTITDVAIDLDGVMFDFASSATFYFSRHLGKPLPAPTHWEFYEDWGLDARTFYKLLDELTAEHDLFDSGAPIHMTDDGVTFLREMGINIHVITHRSPVAFRQTSQWLERFNLLPDGLHFTGMKAEMLTAITNGSCAAVDDHYAQYVSYEHHGVKSFLFNQPWNLAYPNCRRVSNLHEFAQAVYLHNYYWSEEESHLQEVF